MAQLKKLSIHCDFKAELNNHLRDRLVCGVNIPHIQRRLLSEKELTYVKAVEISVAMETAAMDATELITIKTQSQRHKQTTYKAKT